MRQFLVVIAVTVSTAASVGQTSLEGKPDALVQAAIARSAIRTARIEWSLRLPTFPGEKGERTFFYSWRCAGERFSQEKCGDDEGVYSRGDGGIPLESRFQRPEGALLMDGLVWHSEGPGPMARVWERQHRDRFRLFDMRTLGFRVTGSDEDLDRKRAEAGLAPVEYETTREGDLYHVIGRTPEAVYHWWIAEAWGWNIVRASFVTPDGRTGAESEFDLAQYDGHWFPARMRQYRGDRQTGELFQDLRIVHAEFNRPEHPQELTPTLIGIEPGTALQSMYIPDPVMASVWDGSGVVSLPDFSARVGAGQVAYGPTLLRERARVVARSERLARAEAAAAVTSTAVTWRDIEAAWERYTRQFVERYRLEDKQAEQAGRICAACQQQARDFIDRNRDKLEALDAGEPRERRAELLGRIDEIFDQRLKARLLALPIDAQRDAAAKLPPIPEPRLLTDGGTSRSGASRSDAAER